MGDIQVSEATLLGIWNDIKEFGASFWVFILLINMYWLRNEWVNLVKQLFSFITLKAFKKKHIKQYKLKELKEHPIFKSIDYWLDVGIKAIALRNVSVTENSEYMFNKEKMAKEVIRIKYETVRDSLAEFINENDLENIDCLLAYQYFTDCWNRISITQSQKYIERGISQKFLKKYYMISKLSEKIILDSVKHYFNPDDELTTISRIYLAYNAINSYLNVVFNNIFDTIESINGDLKNEMFDGQPMCPNVVHLLRPAHPTYKEIVEEKLNKILSEFNGSRAFVCKYFLKDGKTYHSAVYEQTLKGVTSELMSMQMISLINEKEVFQRLKEGTIIAADISKFNSHIIERFNTRGVKAMIICPIFNNGIVDGSLCIDYITIEKFESISNMKNLDAKMKEYANVLSPYIIYPDDYEF